MFFDGQTIKVDSHDGGIAELYFERGVEAVNKLDALTFGEPRRALDAMRGHAVGLALDNVDPTECFNYFLDSRCGSI